MSERVDIKHNHFCHNCIKMKGTLGWAMATPITESGNQTLDDSRRTWNIWVLCELALDSINF